MVAGHPVLHPYTAMKIADERLHQVEAQAFTLSPGIAALEPVEDPGLHLIRYAGAIILDDDPVIALVDAVDVGLGDIDLQGLVRVRMLDRVPDDVDEHVLDQLRSQDMALCRRIIDGDAAAVDPGELLLYALEDFPQVDGLKLVFHRPCRPDLSHVIDEAGAVLDRHE